MKKQQNTCPCGSDMDMMQCCGKYLSGDEIAPTAEALMRSRYSAYVTGNEDYLLATWHESTRPKTLGLEQDKLTKWVGLSIKVTQKGRQQDQEGVVEFVARYKVNGKAERLHESSRFVKEQGEWFYLDGVLQ